LKGKINFVEIFGRSSPVHIEVGSGKGTFLLHHANTRPDVNILGIEWARKYYRRAVDRMGRWGITNVRVIRTDAARFIAEHVPEDSVECYHIYFPDPWPKRRHHKRRLIQHDNFDRMIKTLKAEGTIRIATDHQGYFQQISSVISERAEILEEMDFTPAPGAEPGELTGTNYERKYRRDGRGIYTLAVRKKTDNSAD